MKNELGIVIATVRRRRMLKQNYMAFKLGTTVHSYANLERGRTDICFKKLVKIGLILSLKASNLVMLAEILKDNPVQILNCEIENLLRKSNENI